METYSYTPGASPLVMSIPHVGEAIPAEVAAQLTDAGPPIADTDWYLDRLYNFADQLGLHVLKAICSRYVIDLNRSPDNESLYPGANVTELVPTSTFAERPLYLAGEEPDENEIDRRRTTYWQPYHDKLSEILKQIKDRHGYAILFDCHSIKSVVPRFFDGKLPDFNLGTSGGLSCAVELRDRLATAMSQYGSYSLAIDGRFKGGYITRQYGAPNDGIHSFQLELSIATYMDEEPEFQWREDLAEQVRPSLKKMLSAACKWHPA